MTHPSGSAAAPLPGCAPGYHAPDCGTVGCGGCAPKPAAAPLLPCPCGKPALLTTDMRRNKKGARVACQDPLCEWVIERRDLGGESIESLKAQAVTVWNRRACVPAVAAPEAWRPIESAPRETWVLIGAWANDEWKFGQAMQFMEYGNRMEGENYDCLVWSTDDQMCPEEPTHWMPLPPAPAVVLAPPEDEKENVK